MKTATIPEAGNLEMVAFCGGLAEWSNATGLRPADDAYPIVQGFESLTRRQNSKYAPAEAGTSTGAKIRTAKAVRTFQFDYPAFGCAPQGDFSHDVPQLPDRSSAVRKAPQRPTALPLRPMR